LFSGKGYCRILRKISLILGIASKSEATVDESNFEEYKTAVFREFENCKVQKQGPASRKLEGFVGHNYRLGCDTLNGKVIHTGNLYTGKHYAYTVMALYPAGTDPLGVLRFTDSFSLIDRSK
jgi:hypothetical protein